MVISILFLQFVNVFGWITAIIFACMVVYGIHDEVKGNPMSVPVAALYNAFSRSIWGICVAWVIFSCVNGYGGMYLVWGNNFGEEGYEIKHLIFLIGFIAQL